jgi:hypothetical protein
MLLVGGIPLRRVSAFLKVKLDTARRWLRLIEKPDDQLDAWVLKEIGVSREELEVLRAFIKTKTLRQRAGLVWHRYRSRMPLSEKMVA